MNFLFFQDNYNKKIAPFSFDKINNVNIPVNISVSMSVIDIIKIAEVKSLMMIMMIIPVFPLTIVLMT